MSYLPSIWGTLCSDGDIAPFTTKAIVYHLWYLFIQNSLAKTYTEHKTGMREHFSDGKQPTHIVGTRAYS